MANFESLQRSLALDEIAARHKQAAARIVKGTDAVAIQMAEQKKRQLLAHFGASAADWDDPHWQLQHRICDVQTLQAVFELDEARAREIAAVGARYFWTVSPYYLSLVDANDPFDPLGLISLPNALELRFQGEPDPMSESLTNPADSVTRRYPDRAIINVTNRCAVYCRFCQRKRAISPAERNKSNESLDAAIAYIAAHASIRDVLITGGDPLTLEIDELEAILARVREISHVEIIRLGTRIPVTVPQRIDAALTEMLKRYHPLFINTHFNHPRELTPDAMAACGRLADAGIPLGNQSVLLNGVNNDKHVMLLLCRELLRARVRPYYLFQAKNVISTTHFICDIRDGIEIVGFLRGNTSGLAIPTYIVNAPHGWGKVPLNPSRCKWLDERELVLHTWEGKEIRYHSDATPDIRALHEAFRHAIPDGSDPAADMRTICK